jgi:hypothetical protein
VHPVREIVRELKDKAFVKDTAEGKNIRFIY